MKFAVFRLLPSVICLLFLALWAPATEPDHQLKVEWDATNTLFRLIWPSVNGRTYFVQHSGDLIEQPWNWLPQIESGDGTLKEWAFVPTEGSDRGFWRLSSTDMPTTDPANADFDDDGVGSLAEIMQGTHPLVVDEDGDGLWDVFEITLIQAGLGDFNGDGLITLEDVRSEDDYDGDGFANGEELATMPGTHQPVSDVKSNLSMPKQSPPFRYAVVPIEVLSEDRFLDQIFGFTDSGYLLYSMFANWGDDPAIFYRWNGGIREELTSANSLNPWVFWVFNITESGAAVGYYEAGEGLSPAFTSQIPVTQTVAALWSPGLPGQPVELPYGSYTWNASLVYNYTQNGQSLTGTVTGTVHYAQGLALDGNVVYGRMCVNYQEQPIPNSNAESFTQTFQTATWTNGGVPALYDPALSVYMARGGVTAGYRLDAQGPGTMDDVYLPQINGQNVDMVFYDMDIYGRMLGERKVGYTLTGDIQLYDGPTNQFLELPVPDAAVPYAFGGGDQYLGSAAGMDAVALWLRNEERNKHVPYNLNDLVGEESGWSITLAHKVNSSSMVIAEAQKDGTDYLVALVPMDIAVDANRDGTIKFGSSTDKTEQDKPFRFWINNDQDINDANDTDKVPVVAEDQADNEINSARDLEDFARLHLTFGGPENFFTNGIKLGFKWKNQTGAPGIKIYRAYETDGKTQYLTDVTTANKQWTDAAGFTGKYRLAIAGEGGVTEIKPGNGVADFIFTAPADMQFDPVDPKKYFLFEATGEGKGQLTMVFIKDGQVIGEGPDVWLDLMDIKKMYQRQDGSGQNQWPNVTFAPDPQEDKDVIVFVHGWRMSPEGASSYAETMFKRLWHRGYKGRFAAYRWNTNWSNNNYWWIPYNGAGEIINSYLSEYNNSEHHAWLAGVGLRDFVNGMPSGYRRHITAHSMGNIVAGSALAAQPAMVINNYALMQGAVPSACYDESEQLKQAPGQKDVSGTTIAIWDNDTPDDDPDAATRALAYRGRLKNGAGNLINFYLPDDYATSYAWEINNDQTKRPANLPFGPALTANFQYLRNNPAGQKLYKYSGVDPLDPDNLLYYLSDPHEAMPYVCRTWGKAVGAEGRTRGSVNNTPVNMSDSSFGGPEGFGTEHCAQFIFSIQNLKGFYSELLRSFSIERNP